MKKEFLILLAILLIKANLFSQMVPIGNAVKIDRLIKREMKFYHEDSSAVLFTGEAYSLHPGTRSIECYWSIVRGETIQFIIYLATGRKFSESNYTENGLHSDKYFQANNQGDTLTYGQYKNGKEIGNLIITDSSGARKEMRY